jgi:hypothetical protein
MKKDYPTTSTTQSQRHPKPTTTTTPGSPAGRPRISAGDTCPGAPIKKRSSPSQRRTGDDYFLFSHFDSAQQQSVDSPLSAAAGGRRQAIPRRLFPSEEVRFNDSNESSNNHLPYQEFVYEDDMFVSSPLRQRRMGRRLFDDFNTTGRSQFRSDVNDNEERQQDRQPTSSSSTSPSSAPSSHNVSTEGRSTTNSMNGGTKEEEESSSTTTTTTSRRDP